MGHHEPVCPGRRFLVRGMVHGMSESATDPTAGPPCAECGAPVVYIGTDDPALPLLVCTEDMFHEPEA